MLTQLRRIVSAFNQQADLTNALQQMTQAIKQVMSTDCCSVHLADHQQQHFVLTASDGLSQDALGRVQIGFSEGLIGLVAQREEPINLANAKLHPRFKYVAEVKEDDYQAFLGTPIIYHRKVVGVISVQQKQARHFSETEEAFLVTLAAQIAPAIQHAESRALVEQPKNKSWRKKLQGIAASSGIVCSQVVVIQPAITLSAIKPKKVFQKEHQIERLTAAIEQTLADFEQMVQQLSAVLDTNALAIFDVYRQLLASQSLVTEIHQQINEGWSAESALKIVIEGYSQKFEALDDDYIRERGSDIRDLGDRILLNLKNFSLDLALPEHFVLVAEEITPSILAQYQDQGLQAIVSLRGSNNSHVAILARAIGIPAVMGLEHVPLAIIDGEEVIVDGYSGEIFISPNQALKTEYQYIIQQETALSDKINQAAELPCITEDGHSIELSLNAGLINGFEHQKHLGQLGIGLYRTELLFLDRQGFPSEKEQTHWYQQVLAQYPQREVTMRTLDIGGDKSLTYFPITEENPFLGWRGIRVTLDHPDIFLVQVRAMIKANIEHKNLNIMLPMITSVNEVDEANRLINQAYYELREEYQQPIAKPKVGIMLEVPSVLYQLPALAKRVDFFSVGSNDLTQYLLAVDRNNNKVASLYSGFHPAVLSALNHIAEQSKALMIPLSLCGELASEPAGALLLLAMGYDQLSMNAHNIAKIKWVIRHSSYQRARVILDHVLTLSSVDQVMSYLNEQLEYLGLGGFIRAGL